VVVAAVLAKTTIDIGIVTTDAAASAEFYGGALGFPELAAVTMDGFAVRRFQVGDCVLKVLQYDKRPGATAPGGDVGDATGIRYWTISITNFDETLEACRQGGGTVLDGPNEVRPGVSIVLIADPHGNIFELAGRPPA
jgi:catechol 2,3-dioxygenase-like lactoylglutathione lyase family enzyme